MVTIKESLSSWREMEENLEKIKRYHKMKVMFYRSNDLIHSKRVHALYIEILPFVLEKYPDFNVKLGATIALHHDDHETVSKRGDVPLQLKLDMTIEEKSALEEEEIFAINLLVKKYPRKINGFSYKKIMMHALRKDCAESQVVSFCDKIDGLCEAIHEVLAGNNIFMEPIINYYNKSFNKLEIKYDLIKDLFDIRNVWFDFNKTIDLIDFFDGGLNKNKSHNQASIKRKTVIPQYEIWKKITVQNFGIEPLTKKVEFQKNNLLKLLILKLIKKLGK